MPNRVLRQDRSEDCFFKATANMKPFTRFVTLADRRLQVWTCGKRPSICCNGIDSVLSFWEQSIGQNNTFVTRQSQPCPSWESRQRESCARPSCFARMRPSSGDLLPNKTLRGIKNDSRLIEGDPMLWTFWIATRRDTGR
jgi:hypothetical protein